MTSTDSSVAGKRLARAAALALVPALVIGTPGALGAQNVHYGDACTIMPAPAPTIDLSAYPLVETPFTVDVTGLPLQVVIIVIGVSDTTWAGLDLPLDLEPFGWSSGCSLLASAELMMPMAFDVFGNAQIVVNSVAMKHAGKSVYLQAFGVTPGLTVSDGLKVTFASSLLGDPMPGTGFEGSQISFHGEFPADPLLNASLTTPGGAVLAPAAVTGGGDDPLVLETLVAAVPSTAVKAPVTLRSGIGSYVEPLAPGAGPTFRLWLGVDGAGGEVSAAEFTPQPDPGAFSFVPGTEAGTFDLALPTELGVSEFCSAFTSFSLHLGGLGTRAEIFFVDPDTKLPGADFVLHPSIKTGQLLAHWLCGQIKTALGSNFPGLDCNVNGSTITLKLASGGSFTEVFGAFRIVYACS